MKHASFLSGPVLLLALVAALAACGSERAAAPVPAPPLAAAEPGVRERVLAARAAVLDAPRDAEAWGRFGMVLDAHGLVAEALACYAEAERLAPGDARWPGLRATLLAPNEPERALEALARAERIEGRFAPTQALAGDLLRALARPGEARARYEAALEADGSHRRARLALAELALEAGRLDEAARHLEEALRQAFGDREVHQLLARLDEARGEGESAARESLLARAYEGVVVGGHPLRTLVEAEAVSTRALQNRANALLRAGRTREAAEAFGRVLATRPGDPAALAGLAEALRLEGRASEAFALVRDALHDEPRVPELRLALAVLLAEQGREDEALGEVRAALAIDDALPDAFYDLGWVLERQGRLPEARDAYRQALARDPVHARSHTNLARVLVALGRPQEATVHFRDAYDFDRENPDTRFNLAVHLAGVHAFAEAARLLEEGVARHPERVPFLAALATIRATAPDASVRDGREAVALADRLRGLLGDDHVPTLGLRAAALAEAGRFPEAVAAAERGLRLAEGAGQQEEAAELERRLVLYRAGRPWHQGR